MASQPIPESEDHRELVDIFETLQESEALVVRGLLQSAGIEALVSGLDFPLDVLPGVGGVVVRVPAESADQARRLIEDYRAGNTADVIEQDDSDRADEPPTA